MSMQVLVSQPAEKPAALLDGLAVLFASIPDISAAYFAQVSGSAMRNEPHFIVGVAITGGLRTMWPKLLTDIGPVARSANLTLGLEVEAINPNDPNDPWLSTLKIYEPFYTRKSA
jgi:hypothetical protein